MNGATRVAVITGGHSYDVPNFHGLFRELEGCEAYIQHMDDFASSSETGRDSYDVVLFYIMLMKGPTDEGIPWYSSKPKTALKHLGATKQGIFVLHHAILAYPEWDAWNRIVGIENRRFGCHPAQRIRVEVTDSAHPITEGLTGWERTDETYTMAEPGGDSRVLLSVQHEKSMKVVGWVRRHGQARVFGFQSGHDNATWVDGSFRRVLARGIAWCARRI